MQEAFLFLYQMPGCIFPLVFYPCNTGIMTVPFVKSPKLWSLWIFICEITINCLNYNIKHLFSKFVLQFSFLMIAFSPYKNYINAFFMLIIANILSNTRFVNDWIHQLGTKKRKEIMIIYQNIENKCCKMWSSRCNLSVWYNYSLLFHQNFKTNLPWYIKHIIYRIIHVLIPK